MPTSTFELACASLPNPLWRLACLRAHTPLQMRLRHFPHHYLYFRTPASYSAWLTILTALRGPQWHPLPPLRLLAPTAYHPYTHGVPSQNASDTAYHPYSHIVPARHAFNAAYHPYARNALPTCL
ncbi:hypothetical protein O181_048190 [Austropuccinia psidii MF-1]|uniref:Uncharacterized protein n=1 Tax=Austropuccinia psidii MF-1 TaxID=1389203 RepID=A0A9Q3DWS2_9BASI|nr:hypothetical protein [Austropuccinia psidii MF-1]